MSQFDDLLAEVYELTKHPNLVAETKLAIRQATLEYHLHDFYPRDIITGTATIAGGTPAAFVLPINTFPRVRIFSTLRVIDPLTDLPGESFEIVREPRHMLDDNLRNRTQVATVMGTNVVIYATAPVSKLAYAYYAHPVMSPEVDYYSWIAAEYKEAVSMAAQARVYRSMGRLEEANSLRADVESWKRRIDANHLESVAR